MAAAAASTSVCAPPAGSGMMPSTKPSRSKSGAVIFKACAASAAKRGEDVQRRSGRDTFRERQCCAAPTPHRIVARCGPTDRPAAIPTLTAVQGIRVAGGLELALLCGPISAAEGTKLGLAETRIGIIPVAGGIGRIATRAGLGRARAIALICLRWHPDFPRIRSWACGVRRPLTRRQWCRM